MLKKYHVEDKLYDPFKSCKKDLKKDPFKLLSFVEQQSLKTIKNDKSILII